MDFLNRKIGRRQFISASSVVIGALIILMMFFTACDKTPPASIKSVDTGSIWEVNDTTSLSELNIAKGTTIKAPDGKSLTMTVDGVKKSIVSGTYNGNIVLTVTKIF